MTGKTILKWISGIFFLLGGIVGIFQTPLVGFISILIGLFILPPTYKIIEEKTNLKLTSPIKWIITIVGVVVMGIAVSSSKSSKDKEVDVIVENASKKIDEGKIDEGLKLIKEAKSKYSSSENKATELEKEIQKSKDVEFAKQTLAQMSDEEFKQLKANSLNKAYLTVNQMKEKKLLQKLNYKKRRLDRKS
jgi:predicted PurR-regulated permease PerM